MYFLILRTREKISSYLKFGLNSILRISCLEILLGDKVLSTGNSLYLNFLKDLILRQCPFVYNIGKNEEASRFIDVSLQCRFLLEKTDLKSVSSCFGGDLPNNFFFQFPYLSQNYIFIILPKMKSSLWYLISSDCTHSVPSSSSERSSASKELMVSRKSFFRLLGNARLFSFSFFRLSHCNAASFFFSSAFSFFNSSFFFFSTSLSLKSYGHMRVACCFLTLVISFRRGTG